MIDDWSKYANFSKWEFDCSTTNENNMNPYFMTKLQELRDRYGKSISISSGFRSVKHPAEVKKKNGGGYHTKGLACDIPCYGNEAITLIQLALAVGFTGIGVSQRKGKPRYIHLDLRPIDDKTIWSY